MLQGLIELKKIEVFSAAVIKKRQYWPGQFPVQEIDNYTNKKYTGDAA